MARVVVTGAGVVGLATAMLLADDGHDVTVLERDPRPPPSSAEAAWGSWERKGVNQFRLPHMFMARFRAVLEAELPRVAKAAAAAGALRKNAVLDIPEAIRGPERPRDHEMTLLTARRPVMEAAVAAAAAETDNLTVRRGTAVAELITGASARPGIPHVTGVRTDSGEEVPADLVLDMMGRRSPLPRLLEGIGARPLHEVLEDSGFMYYGRHFRSADGSLPFAFGAPLLNLGSISTITLSADNGTWAVAVITHSADKQLYGLRDVGRWEAFVRSLPLVAHWIDAEALEDRVISMSKIEDRLRDLMVDGQPVVTGLLAVADAWACSNPALGRGASIGLLHGLLLRDTLRGVGTDDPYELACAFHSATTEQTLPWFQWTRSTDRHRLAEVAAAMDGREYRPDDPRWELEKKLASAAGKDPDCLRASARPALVLESLEEALAVPGVRDKIEELGAGWRDDPIPAPSRAELVALANA